MFFGNHRVTQQSQVQKQVHEHLDIDEAATTYVDGLMLNLLALLWSRRSFSTIAEIEASVKKQVRIRHEDILSRIFPFPHKHKLSVDILRLTAASQRPARVGGERGGGCNSILHRAEEEGMEDRFPRRKGYHLRALDVPCRVVPTPFLLLSIHSHTSFRHNGRCKKGSARM